GGVRGAQLRALPAIRAHRAVALDPASNGVEQILLAERLRQELDGAGLHGADRHWNVAVAGEEDDRQLGLRVGELALQIEPAEPREPHIQHEASRRIGTACVQERAAPVGWERTAPYPCRPAWW